MASTANEKTLLEIAAVIDEHKGEATVILDVRGECGFADYFIITTARSARHLSSLSAYVRECLVARGLAVLNRPQPGDSSGWTLIDCGHIIIHVMEQAARAFYELEKLWFRAKAVGYSSKSS